MINIILSHWELTQKAKCIKHYGLNAKRGETKNKILMREELLGLWLRLEER